MLILGAPFCEGTPKALKQFALKVNISQKVFSKSQYLGLVYVNKFSC